MYSSYVELQSAHVKLYLWIDRVKLDRIGKRPQQTLTTGCRDRAKIIDKTRNRVDLAVDQGPFWMKLVLSCRCSLRSDAPGRPTGV